MRAFPPRSCADGQRAGSRTGALALLETLSQFLHVVLGESRQLAAEVEDPLQCRCALLPEGNNISRREQLLPRLINHTEHDELGPRVLRVDLLVLASTDCDRCLVVVTLLAGQSAHPQLAAPFGNSKHFGM